MLWLGCSVVFLSLLSKMNLYGSFWWIIVGKDLIFIIGISYSLRYFFNAVIFVRLPKLYFYIIPLVALSIFYFIWASLSFLCVYTLATWGEMYFIDRDLIPNPEEAGFIMLVHFLHHPYIRAEFIYLFAIPLLVIVAQQAVSLKQAYQNMISEHIDVHADLALEEVAPQNPLHLGEFLKIKDRHKTLFLLFTDIIYIKAWGDYVQINLLGGRTQTVSYSLQEIEGKLNANFVRIHRSHIINIQYLSAVDASKVNLSNQIEIPIGVKYREKFYLYLELPFT